MTLGSPPSKRTTRAYMASPFTYFTRCMERTPLELGTSDDGTKSWPSVRECRELDPSFWLKRSVLRCRQSERDTCSAPRPPFCPHPTSVGLDESAGNRKAEA